MTSTVRSTQEVEHQRTAALAQANHTRSQCKRLREEINAQPPREGAILVARVLLKPPQFLANMKTGRLLLAIHGIGAKRAREIARLRLATPIGALSIHERVRIAAETVRRCEHMVRKQPPRTPAPEVSARALLDANQIRFARSGACHDISRARDPLQGAFRAAKLIIASDRAVELDGLSVLAVLEAVPGMGNKRARRVLEQLHVGISIELRALSRPRAVALASALIAQYSPPPAPNAADPLPALNAVERPLALAA